MDDAISEGYDKRCVAGKTLRCCNCITRSQRFGLSERNLLTRKEKLDPALAIVEATDFAHCTALSFEMHHEL